MVIEFIKCSNFHHFFIGATKPKRSEITPPVIKLTTLHRFMTFFSTALHQGLSKYLTAQDTLGIPTLTKHNRTLARLGYLLSLQARSTLKINWFFFSVSSIE